MNDTKRGNAGQKPAASAACQSSAWAGVKTTADRLWHGASDIAEDIVILSQFAFGREYIRRPAA